MPEKGFTLKNGLSSPEKQLVMSMKNKHLSLIYTIGLLSLATVAIQDAQADTNIANGSTVTAPPQANDAMNFQAPAPGGTFVIGPPSTTFVGTITNAGAGIGTLVLNSGSQLNGAVARAIA